MKLYVAVLDVLPSGDRLAQCAHAVAEIHATQPDACAAWREESNTVVVLTMPARNLARLAEHQGAASFREPDRGDELTAVATFPTAENRSILKRASLAR